MKHALLIGLLTFVGIWLLAMAADAVTYLHWPNPVDWKPSSRGMIFIEGLLFAFGAGVMSLVIGKRP